MNYHLNLYEQLFVRRYFLNLNNHHLREYQLQKVKAQNIAKVMWGDFMRQASIAKAKCLMS